MARYSRQRDPYDYDNTHYSVTRPHPDTKEWPGFHQNIAELHVVHKEHRGATTYPLGRGRMKVEEWDYDSHEQQPRTPNTYTWEDDRTAWDAHKFEERTGPQKGQGKLFHLEETPESVTADSLFTSREGRVHAPTLLGIADNDARARYGMGLAPPADLSPHSSRMVKHLKGTGAVKDSAADAVTNNYTFQTPTVTDPDALQERIPDAEITAGRRRVRAVLRGGTKPAGPANVGEQFRLF